MGARGSRSAQATNFNAMQCGLSFLRDKLGAQFNRLAAVPIACLWEG